MHRIIAVQTRSYPTLLPPNPGGGAPWGIFFHPGARTDVTPSRSELWVMPITQGEMGGVVGDPVVYWTAPEGWTISALFYSTLSGVGRVYVAVSSSWYGDTYAFGEGEMPQHIGVSSMVATTYNRVSHAAEFAGMLYLSLTGGGLTATAYVERLDPRTGERAVVASAQKQGLAPGGLAVQGGTLYWSQGDEVYASPDGSSWSLAYPRPAAMPRLYVGIDGAARNLGGFVTDQATGVVYCGGNISQSVGIYRVYTGELVDSYGLPIAALFQLSGGVPSEVWRGTASFVRGYRYGTAYTENSINAVRFLDRGSTRSGPYGHNDWTTVTALEYGVGPLIVASAAGGSGLIPLELGWRGAPNQAMASYGGSLYAILYDAPRGTPDYYESTLARFDGASWAAVRRFPYCRPDTTGAICVPNTGYLCHEV